MRRRRDEGSVLLLAVFLCAVLAGLVAVVVDASAAFLARRALASQADGAAARAAQSLDLDAYYRGDGESLPLSGVDDAVAAYVGTSATILDVRLSPDATAVTVTLGRHVNLPLAPPGYGGGLDVTATATARLR